MILYLYNNKKRGELFMTLQYNEQTERYNEFNSGECFKVKVNNKWKEVRIEIGAKGWYLIDEDGFTSSCKRLEGAEIQEIK